MSRLSNEQEAGATQIYFLLVKFWLPAKIRYQERPSNYEICGRSRCAQVFRRRQGRRLRE